MDDYEIGQLLKENLKLSRENNRILRKLHGHLKWSRFFRILYWTLIIGSALGIYWFLQPYFENLRDTYGAFLDFVDNPKETIEGVISNGGGQ